MVTKVRNLAAKTFLIHFLVLATVAQGAIKEDPSSFRLTDGSTALPKQSVYVYGDGALDLLVPVQVLGSVVKAGIHYIPANTDLVTLLSLAGGTTPQANEEEIVVKRRMKDHSEVVKVNLEKLIEDPYAQNPMLVSGDAIVIPQEKPFLSENVVRTVSVIGGIAGAIATTILIARGMK